MVKRHRHLRALAISLVGTIIAMLFYFGPPLQKASASILLVQTAKNTGTTTVSATWTSSTTTGNLLVAVISSLKIGSIPTISAPSGWSQANTTGWGTCCRTTIFYKESAASESSTGDFSSASGDTLVLIVAEYSGVTASSSLDQTAATFGENPSPSTGTTGTTTQADELLIGGIGSSSSVTYSSPGNSFSIENQQASTPSGVLLDRIVSSTGTYSTYVTQSSVVTWGGVIATFKAETTSSGGNTGSGGSNERKAKTPGSITINVKTIGGDGNFSFLLMGSKYQSSFKIKTQNGSGSNTESSIPSGNYLVLQMLPNGWINIENSCFLTEVLQGQNTTCTITNSLNSSSQTISAGNYALFAKAGVSSAVSTRRKARELNCNSENDKQVDFSGSFNQVYGRVHSNADIFIKSNNNFNDTLSLSNPEVTYGSNDSDCVFSQGPGNVYNSGNPTNLAKKSAADLGTGGWPGNLGDFLNASQSGAFETFSNATSTSAIGIKCDTGRLTGGGTLKISAQDNGKVVCHGSGQMIFNLSNQGTSQSPFRITMISHGPIEISGKNSFLAPAKSGVLAWTDVSFSSAQEAIKLLGTNVNIIESAIAFAPRSGINVSLSEAKTACIQAIGQGSVAMRSSNLDFGPYCNKQKKGSITLDKVTLPSSKTEAFKFTTVNLPDPQAPSLSDSSSPIAWNDLAEGVYSISETVPLGFTQSISCNGQVASIVSNILNGVQIQLKGAENIVCTFTNTATVQNIPDEVPEEEIAEKEVEEENQAYLVINAYARGGDDSFQYSIGGPTSAGTSIATKNGIGSFIIADLTDGLGYQITQDAKRGWKLESVSCTTENGGATGLSDGNNISYIIIEPERTTTCNFYNIKENMAVMAQDQNLLENIFDIVVEAIEPLVEAAREILEIPAVATTVDVVIATALATSAAAVVFAPAFSVTEILSIPLRLWGLVLSLLGIRKKTLQWGVVYDSQTKQPLDPAYVLLMDANGKEVTTAITDIDGRYGFLVEPGTYTISAAKTNYAFPSTKIKQDEVYENIYFGSQIEVKRKGEVISKNIPLDPIKFDWNEFAKKDKKFMKFYSTWDKVIRKISEPSFIVGFVVSTLVLLLVPKPYNIIIFSCYLGLLFLKSLMKALGFQPKSTGYITDKQGVPLSFAVIKVVLPSTNAQIAMKIADQYGRYYCLVPKGKYYLKVDKKNADGSYTKVYTSQLINASKNGIIRENFKI